MGASSEYALNTMSASRASATSARLTPRRCASSSSLGPRPSSCVSFSVALRTSSMRSWADRRTWTCHRLSRKCRLISPVTHGSAYPDSEPPNAGSKLLIAFSRPTYPACIRSSAGSGLPRYCRTHERTSLVCRATRISQATARCELPAGLARKSASSGSSSSSLSSPRVGGAPAVNATMIVS